MWGVRSLPKVDRFYRLSSKCLICPTRTMNRPRHIAILLTLFALTGTGSVLAQAASQPQPDQHGNYFSNDTPIRGTAPSPLMAGSLWQVMSRRLNCRSNAGMQYKITQQFKQGKLLQADVGRGGSDEVLLNITDQQGQPWMRVRSAQGKNYNCYVRANRLYIQPSQGTQ